MWYLKQDKRGAVTVEFVVLTAAVVLITTATVATFHQNVDNKVDTIAL
jgi:Flp pilus assembly pilin Flp